MSRGMTQPAISSRWSYYVDRYRWFKFFVVPPTSSKFDLARNEIGKPIPTMTGWQSLIRSDVRGKTWFGLCLFGWHIQLCRNDGCAITKGQGLMRGCA